MASRPKREWYFVCECGAKFFHEEQGVECPRCGEQLASREQPAVPWKLLTVAEACHALSISPSSLYDMASKGEISHRRVRGGIRFAEDDLEEYLEERKRGRKSAPVTRKTDPRPRRKPQRNTDWF